MENKITWISIAYVIIFSMTFAYADTIYTKDGEVINAKIVDETDKTVWYEAQSGRVGISKDSVSKIEKSDGTISKHSPNFEKIESINQEISQPDYIEVFEETEHNQDREVMGIEGKISISMDKMEPPYDMEFVNKLEQGEPYVGTFKHPFTGEMLERKVVGMEGDKCIYIEEMPNGGRMECKFSPSQRKAAAQFYKDELVRKPRIATTEFEFDSAAGKQKTTYTVDGKEVENPLQEALENGVCVIKGYGQNE